MARSFTHPTSNKLFVSRLASPEVVSFLRSRRNDAEYAPHETKSLEKPALGLVADLIHETCHFWCFDSFVGQAMALIDIRQRLLACLSPQLRVEEAEVLRDLSARALMAPLAEGLALFTEFDVWRSENFGKSRTPIAVLDMFFSHGNLKSHHAGFLMDHMLEDQRDAPAYIRRKVDLYLNRFEVDQGYVPGYIAIKNFYFWLARSFPDIKQETVLRFLKDYFWNDPTLARLILAGPDTDSDCNEPLSQEQFDVLNARLANQDVIAVRREHFRRSRQARVVFDNEPVLARLGFRVRCLLKDPSLGGKLGALQARIEHGIPGVPTWEIGIDEDDVERFQAAELEMRNYAFQFFDTHPLAEQAGVKALAAPLLLGLPELRRVSPLLSLYLRVDEDPEHAVKCSTVDGTTMFEVPGSQFSQLAPGTYTYFLLASADSLECRELILDPDFEPVADPVLRTFLADVGIDEGNISFYLRVLLASDQLDLRTEEYTRKCEALVSATDVAHRAEEAAMRLYLDVATMFVNDPARRENVKTALRAEGLRACLPARLKLIDLAARLSLLGNAAANLEEFAAYLAIRADRDFDMDSFMSDVQEIMEADRHQVIFGRLGNRIVRSI